MYERMLEKGITPSAEKIAETLGEGALGRLEELEAFLGAHYDLARELRFPFGSQYGWGYKYAHKSKHLCYAFFEKGAFTVTIQLGDREVPAVTAKLPELLPITKQLWEHRYPCGEQGGWIHYRVLDRDQLRDVLELIRIKKAPGR